MKCMHEPHDAGQVCHWNLIMYDCLANTVRFQVFGMLDVSCAHCQGEGNDRSRQSVSGCCSISSSGGGAHAAVAESPARSPHLPPVSPEPIIALVLVVALPPPIPPTRKSRCVFPPCLMSVGAVYLPLTFPNLLPPGDRFISL